MRMRRNILSSVASPASLYFSTLSKKDTIVEQSYWTQNVCFNFLYNFCLKHFSF